MLTGRKFDNDCVSKLSGCHEATNVFEAGEGCRCSLGKTVKFAKDEVSDGIFRVQNTLSVPIVVDLSNEY